MSWPNHLAVRMTGRIILLSEWILLVTLAEWAWPSTSGLGRVKVQPSEFVLGRVLAESEWCGRVTVRPSELDLGRVRWPSDMAEWCGRIRMIFLWIKLAESE